MTRFSHDQITLQPLSGQLGQARAIERGEQVGGGHLIGRGPDSGRSSYRWVTQIERSRLERSRVQCTLAAHVSEREHESLRAEELDHSMVQERISTDGDEIRHVHFKRSTLKQH